MLTLFSVASSLENPKSPPKIFSGTSTCLMQSLAHDRGPGRVRVGTGLGPAQDRPKTSLRAPCQVTILKLGGEREFCA